MTIIETVTGELQFDNVGIVMRRLLATEPA